MHCSFLCPLNLLRRFTYGHTPPHLPLALAARHFAPLSCPSALLHKLPSCHLPLTLHRARASSTTCSCASLSFTITVCYYLLCRPPHARAARPVPAQPALQRPQVPRHAQPGDPGAQVRGQAAARRTRLHQVSCGVVLQDREQPQVIWCSLSSIRSAGRGGGLPPHPLARFHPNTVRVHAYMHANNSSIRSYVALRNLGTVCLLLFGAPTVARTQPQHSSRRASSPPADATCTLPLLRHACLAGHASTNLHFQSTTMSTTYLCRTNALTTTPM